MSSIQPNLKPRPPAQRPFRTAVLRGLAVLVPPLMTVVIFLWIGSSINQNLLLPVRHFLRDSLVWARADIRSDVPNPTKLAVVTIDGQSYYHTADDKYIPLQVWDDVRKTRSGEPLPTRAQEIYREYVELHYLHPYVMIPFLLSIFVLVLYLLGKFMAAGIGRFFVGLFEWFVTRLPLVRSVYSGVKQVSDFMFKERDIEFTRVVAVEYPRKGMWSIGFVTGEGFEDIHAAANEAVLSVFFPCSPMPFTGYVVNCLRNECIDLNMTFDQAFQFIISCGVVVPATQLPRPDAAALPNGGGTPQASGEAVGANAP